MKSNILKTIKIIQEMIDYICTNKDYVDVNNELNKFIARAILIKKFKYYYKHNYWIFDNLWRNNAGYLTQKIKNLKNGNYKCKFCGRLFDSVDELNTHYKNNKLNDHIQHNFACCQENWCYCQYCGNFVFPVSLCNYPYPFDYQNTVCEFCGEEKLEFTTNSVDL